MSEQLFYEHFGVRISKSIQRKETKRSLELEKNEDHSYERGSRWNASHY